MLPNPLHPAVVHFPLVLAVLIPFAAGAALYVSRRPGAGRGAWVALTVMSLLLAGSAWLSLETGQRQEERVEQVVPERAIGGHEEAAEGLLTASVVLAGVVLLGLASGTAGRVARYLTVPGGLVILAMAIRVGDSGGQLVYRYGAASAYASSGPALTNPAQTGEREGREGRERHGEEGKGDDQG